VVALTISFTVPVESGRGISKGRSKMKKEEIAKLANSLNSDARQLAIALTDINNAITRIEATKNSLREIQNAILPEGRKELKEIK